MILQGEDKALGITIEDSAGVLQSIDAMTDLIAYLYQKSDNTILVKYAKVAATGFITLLRVSATEYTAIVPHTLTETIDITDLMLEVELQEDDARFEANIRRTKGKGKVTNVVESLIEE
jgi:hypothetical protein